MVGGYKVQLICESCFPFRPVVLWRVLASTFRWELLGILAVGLTHYTSWFIAPRCLKLLVNFVSSEGEEERWKGYLYAAMLFLGSALWTFTFQQVRRNKKHILEKKYFCFYGSFQCFSTAT